MLANHTAIDGGDPFVSYARALHEYTLRLWTESIREAEAKGRALSAARETTMRREEVKVHKETVRAKA